MNKTEWEAKTLLDDVGIETPAGWLLDADLSWPVDVPWPVYIKAQVLHGGRGKAGLVVKAEQASDAEAAIRDIHERADGARILFESVVVGAERYVSIGFDPVRCAPVLTIGTRGGVDVEDSDPSTRRSHPIDMRRGLLPFDAVALCTELGLEGRELASMAGTSQKLWDLFCTSEAQLIEINPLIWDGERHVAADAKMVTLTGEDEPGVVFFEREGTVAVISAGAGLGMAIGDALTTSGAPPANFSDIVGGLAPDSIATLVGMVADLAERRGDIKAILVAFSLSNTPVERVLQPLCESLDCLLGVPVVAYVSGLIDGDPQRADELRDDLLGRGVTIVDRADEAIERVANA